MKRLSGATAAFLIAAFLGGFFGAPITGLAVKAWHFAFPPAMTYLSEYTQTRHGIEEGYVSTGVVTISSGVLSQQLATGEIREFDYGMLLDRSQERQAFASTMLDATERHKAATLTYKNAHFTASE